MLDFFIDGRAGLVLRNVRSSKGKEGGDDAAVKAIEQNWCISQMTGDADCVASTMSDQYVHTNLRGDVTGKAATIAELMNRRIRYERLVKEDLRVD